MNLKKDWKGVVMNKTTTDNWELNYVCSSGRGVSIFNADKEFEICPECKCGLTKVNELNSRKKRKKGKLRWK